MRRPILGRTAFPDFAQEGAARRQLVAARGEPRFDYPFATVTRGLRLDEDLRFGTRSPEGKGGTTINDVAALDRHFRPLQGEFAADGTALGGAGATTINSEIQTYSDTFSGGNHSFQPDGLRLQATLRAGGFDSYLRGQIDRRGTGFFANAPGEQVPTPLAAIGLGPDDLRDIEVGDVVTSGPNGLAAVSNIDSVAGTLTFDALSGSAKRAYTGNFHITFTRFAFACLRAPDAIVNGQTRTVVLAFALPRSVVVGSVVRGVRRGADVVFDPASSSPAVVERISPDRRTVTFDQPLRFPWTIGTAGRDGLLFMPGLRSGQIWSKRSYGFEGGANRLQALRIEVTMPSMSNYAATAAYTREAVTQTLADHPDILWGYWPALWLYNWRPGPDGTGQDIRKDATNPWSEIDILEIFTRQGSGPSVWTGNLHDQPYTRQVAADRSLTRALNGGRWLDSAPTRSLQTPNAAALLMPQPIADGRRHSFGIVWSPTTVIHYMDDVAICRSDWPINTTYPHQLGLNVACGSLAGGNPAALMFPQTDADATGQFMTVHSIRSWVL